ncbi:unnamed protein product [Auanema sp. JU1783]|nr:unnamed protein product [Auanema sp. JU1783]
MLLLFFLFSLTCARIIQNRDPKIDPVFFDNIISQIVESSMDDMRYRLRQAIYSVAIKRNNENFTPNGTAPAPGKLGGYEEWLLDQFINQLSRRKLSDVPESNPIEKEQKSTLRDSPISPSHTMSIALETFTTRPTRNDENGLITSSDDSPSPLFLNDEVSEARLTHSEKTLKAYLPSWLLMLTAGSIVALSLLLLLTTTIICRRKRFKMEPNIQRLPNPVHISSFACVPDRNNTPGAFIERIRNQRLTSADRDSESIWGNSATLRTIT